MHNRWNLEKQMYEVENAGDRVKANMTRVIGEEAGERLLNIKRVVYLGAPRVNSSFVTSKSALFGVEVDYETFVQANKVVSDEEFARRKEQLGHEGLMGVVLDMNLDQYVDYKRDSEISRDLAADSATDIVVMDYLAEHLGEVKAKLLKKEQGRKSFVGLLKRMKDNDPAAYKEILKPKE